MSDTLSVLMRELIAAFPEERVQRIPRGVSSEAGYTYVPGATRDADGHLSGGQHWRAGAKVAVKSRARAMRFQALARRETKAPAEERGLVMLSGPTVEPERRPAKPKRVRPSRATGTLALRDQRAAERRERVLAMILAGHSWGETRRALGLGRSTMANDMEALRRDGKLPPAEAREDFEARRVKVREMIASGMTRPAVAKALGCGLTSVANDITALRERGEIPPANPRRQRGRAE